MTTACRICEAPIEPFMSFGPMPVANGFLGADQFADEYFFELAPAFCGGCGMLQLVEQPDARRMFHGSYPFYASLSRHMSAHFEGVAGEIREICGGADDPFVVEIGSNDGVMLRHLAAAGIRHLGIEPSENVAAVAREAGVETVSEFFDEDFAARVADEHGPATVISAANVMCHIPDLNSVAAGIRRLLAPDGVLRFEDPYLGAMIAKTSYDQIYDEHVFIFSATSVASAFARHGLELIDLTPLATHGGSMRYTLAHAGRAQPSAAVARVLEEESRAGLGRAATYDSFRAACEASRDGLRSLLEELRGAGRRVVGYGATSKSTTVANYCGLSPDLVEFIADTTPDKQGKFSPGAHIPVRPHADFAADHPDFALLFAWNHEAEIREKETDFAGRWIRYVPRVEVVA